ncbi:tyrosine-type recombinase/integrase [Deinococcus marmoris]|uniref:tyrosine-type recombinase/integrase n=1 Tax=Deinococcus marmoris TaxID=249408 RepID=UPI0020CA22CE|nr:tyrosine-type recombinase/integrase [Deinococcus marmoris]
MARIKLASVPQVRPPAVSSEAAREALKACAQTRHPLRDRAMLLTMLDTGVRMSELLQLRESDLDVIGGFLRVRAETSKRQRERRIPVGVRAMRAVTTYQRRERRPARATVDTLYLNRSGVPLSVSGLHHVLIRLAEVTGRSRAELAPHAWRRGMATAYMSNGGDIVTLQLILGHATLDQTRVYLRLSDDDLQRRHLRASPADNL